MLLIIVSKFYLIPNLKPGISFINNIIPEVPAQLLINPLGLTIRLEMVCGQ